MEISASISSKKVKKNKPSPDIKWHVFYTVSRHEKKAEEVLIRDGYEVFLPIVEQMRQWSDRKKKVKVPLFGGYIFVKTKNHLVPDVISHFGVVAALKFEKAYAIISDEEIKAIKRLIDTGVYAEAVPGLVKIGDDVVVEEGPLKGYKGKCVREAGTDYLYILVNAVNHSIKVKISAAALRKL
jgi:transcriptional antiterminator NusG